MWALRCGVFLALAAWNTLVFATAGASAWERSVLQGITQRTQGDVERSIEVLEQAVLSASTERERMRAKGELGASLLQARRVEQALASLREAHGYFSGIERARYAMDLGNLASIGKRREEAQGYYEEAARLAGSDAQLALSAALNLTRLAPESERLQQLTALYPQIGAIKDGGSRARLYLNLGAQAHALGKQGVALSFRSYDQARQLSARDANSRVSVESLDALSQLYEDQGRVKEASILTEQAIEAARAQPPGAVGDVLINLEWRRARLHMALNRPDLALAAYQRAVDQIERMRQDLPIDYDDGSSSFRRTLEPIYLGLFEWLLRASDSQSGEAKASTLRRARDAVELIKQAELQDYLGDRCTVDTVKGGTPTVIPKGTAVLYPIILGDRIELLLETGLDIVRFSSRISGAIVRRTAILFANDLRDGATGYLTRSRVLYDWLLRPIEGFIAEQAITTLVVVPDGALRLIAIGALHDGERFAIEKFALATVTGLSMTNTTAPSEQAARFLIAGISEPGPVVEKLSQATVEQLLGPNVNKKIDVASLTHNRSLRSVRSRSAEPAKGDATSRVETLRQALVLPGVKQEVETIGRIASSTTLLNAPFTVAGFRREAESGAYRIVHVASHGVFGGSAESSYVLAYDDLLTLDTLQSLLKSDEFRKSPIELLSLSACETAEGDERSPLGISGAAMKARAKSVLGALWPVEDAAARTTMEQFYRGLLTTRLSKAEALRQSQIELLRTGEFAHPFFWAPFVLIGNWL